MVTARTLTNAVIGAVVGVVLSFVPFSTAVGGLVAGFLEGPDGRRGAIVGALAGAITFLPIAAVATFGLGVLGFGMGIVAAPVEGFALAAVLVVGIVSVLFLYTVGLSLLGGYAGAYLAREYPDRHARTRATLGDSTADRSRSAARRRPPTSRSNGPGGEVRDRRLDRDRFDARDTDRGRADDDRSRDRDRPDVGDSSRDRDTEQDRV